jgi:hypothetical protein
MSPVPKPPIFLQRASYRQRRVRDAAKLIPFVGIVLWALPMSWAQSANEGQVGSEGLIYIFAVWVVLIVLAAILASRIRADTSQDTTDDPKA